ncbi:hypothetical protein Goklo_011417 [Gossypium klotzschianum]|uniref:Uncharacterized protein n=1 Tax=Gossypium klotzschianum TaxID=34286 RepID=A0A7J8V8X6_9ROSI|nr:hypothetical protein [Gossypium klotzschianum]
MLRLASKRLLGLTSREIPSQPVHRHRFGRSSCLWRSTSLMIRVVKSHGWSKKSYGGNMVVIRWWMAKIC